MSDLVELIARAIRSSDRRYFFENYTIQAEAVLAALKKAGVRMVPIEPTSKMLDAGREAMRFGPQRPAELLRETYRAMIEQAPPM